MKHQRRRDVGEAAGDAGVFVADANVGSAAAVHQSVEEDVTGNTTGRRSASNIAKRIKQRGRFCKAAAVRCSPYTTPTRRGHGAKGKRRTVGVTPTASRGVSQAVDRVSVHMVDMVDVNPLPTLNVICTSLSISCLAFT